MRDLIEKGILPEGTERLAIDQIIEEEDIINASLDISAGSNIGDNYLGGVYRIVIKGRGAKYNLKKLSLILKCSTRAGAFRGAMPHNKLFRREIFLYRVYLPTIYNIQREHQLDNGLMDSAKIYKDSIVDMDEYLILDDLKAQGFTMRNRQDTVDMPHCHLVLKQLALFHTLGFIFKHEKSYLWDECIANKEDLMVTYFSKNGWDTQWIVFGKRALDAIDSKADPEVYKFFAKYYKNIPTYMQEMEKPENKDEYCTMIHGDCWINNILFKYDDAKRPTELRFLDYQISHVCSPVKDIAYFIYNSTSTNFRARHLPELLDFYYSELTAAMKRCGASSEKLYPRTVFEQHLKRYFCHGLHMALLTLPLFLTNQDELPDHHKNDPSSGAEFNLEQFNVSTKNDDKYQERISGIIKHAFVNDYLN